MLKILFGIGPWWTAVATIGKDQVIAGDTFKVKTSHARLMENTTIEILEPMGLGIWSEFLATNKGGVHHICYDVSNLQEMIGIVERLGGKMMAAAHVFGKRFCYMRLPTGLVVEFADENLHADAEKLLRKHPLPAVSLDGGHIGTVVKDMEQAMELYKILGYETWWTGDASIPQEAMIAGKGFSVKVAHGLLDGRVIFELLEPTSSGSVMDDYVKNSVGSAHHIGYEVPDWEAMIDKIKGLGGEMMLGADVWGQKKPLTCGYPLA